MNTVPVAHFSRSSLDIGTARLGAAWSTAQTIAAISLLVALAGADLAISRYVAPEQLLAETDPTAEGSLALGIISEFRFAPIMIEIRPARTSDWPQYFRQHGRVTKSSVAAA